MKVIDPQSATLTNIEVLAYLTANPPRRPPNPPPNSRHWVPNPDLRDHNTVVKEIHNYVHRISPHLLNYPRYVHEETLQRLQQQQQQDQQQQAVQLRPSPQPTEPTPMDIAIRELITKLQPYGLTKGEVLMIINLGIGLDKPSQTTQPQNTTTQDQETNAEAMENGEDVSGGGAVAETAEPEGGAGEGQEEEAVTQEDDDYGARALLDTVIEEREERLSNEDITAILAIIRETLGKRDR